MTAAAAGSAAPPDPPIRPGAGRCPGDAAAAAETMTPTERGRYIAALAVGLVTAGCEPCDIIGELATAADHHVQPLRQAIGCVYRLRIGSAQQRRLAVELLTRTTAHIERPDRRWTPALR